MQETMLGTVTRIPNASCARLSNVIAAISRNMVTWTRPHFERTGQWDWEVQSSSPLSCRRHSEKRIGPSNASTASLSVICEAGDHQTAVAALTSFGKKNPDGVSYLRLILSISRSQQTRTL
ncbi:MAG TPA: hypothetical protein VFZ43_07325 [Anaerolineales bacterium]